MNYATQAIATRDARGRFERCATLGLRRRKVQGSMRPMAVVVINENAHNLLKMRLVEHQDPIETFGANRSYESLRDAVGLWRAKRRTNDLDPIAAEHVVETVSELLIQVPNQEPDRFVLPET